MIRVTLAFLVGLSLMALSGGKGVNAADLRLPAALYPAGSRIAYDAQVSNAGMDCSWNFVCDLHEGPCVRTCVAPMAAPLFHLRTQSQLHRVDGWSQIALCQKGRRFAQFAVYVSRYEVGGDWSDVALRDFATAAWLHGYLPATRPVTLNQSGFASRPLLLQRRVGGTAVLLLAYRVGDREEEGMVAATGRPIEQARAERDFLTQMRTAAAELQ